MADDMRPNMFPSLRYKDAHGAISWLERAFGFTRQAVYPGPDGTVGHAELKLGSGAIMLGSLGQPDPASPWLTAYNTTLRPYYGESEQPEPRDAPDLVDFDDKVPPT